MKKVTLILLSLLSFCLSLFCPFVSFQKAVATGNDDIEDIGYLYTIQLVSTTTKVIITDNNIFTYLNDIGRYYTYEWIDVPIGGDDPSPGTLGGGTIAEPNGGTIRVKQYYYYATPTEPKIIGRTMLDNTVYSLRIALQYLENLATHYGNCTNTKDSILGYIRSISKRYVDQPNADFQKWLPVCGPLDSNFINYVDSITSIGMTIREYFASFVKSSEFNDDEHSSCGSNYLQKELFLFDPIIQMAKVDLVHLFASMDGIFMDTCADSTYYLLLTPRTYRYLVSWAGDLQTSTKHIWDNNVNIITFNQILSNNYSFGYDDFFADNDAINIAYNVSLNNTFSLSNLIYNYYQTFDAEGRVEAFCTNIIHMDNENNNLTYNNLKNIVYEMLALNSDGSGMSGIFIFSDFAKYYLLGYNVTHQFAALPSVSTRLNIANLFLQYLWTYFN